ncbi:MAG: TolC family protein [Rhodothermales bacterium]|nr:TolC family protein [Rhodothermales bacterium]
MVSITAQPFPVLSARGTLRSQWAVTQTIPFPGELRSNAELVRASAIVAREQAGVVEDQLVLEVKAAYFQLIQVRDRLALADEFEVRLSDFEESAAALYEVGSGSQHAILKAQIQRSQLDRVRLDLEAARSTARQKIARLLSPDSARIRLDVTFESEIDTYLVVPDSLISSAIANRSDLRTLRALEDEAVARGLVAQKQNKPDFSLGLTYIDVGRSDLIPSANGRDALGVMFGVRIPLWRKPKQARILESSLAVKYSRYKLIDQTGVVETKVQDIIQQLHLVDEQISLLVDDLIPKAEFSFEATLSSYTTGRTDFLDLLDSERTLYEMSNILVVSRFRRRVTIAQLEHALGITWMHELSN